MRRLQDRLGGLHRPPQVDDPNQHAVHREEPGVALARDARLMDLSDVNPF